MVNRREIMNTTSSPDPSDLNSPDELVITLWHDFQDPNTIDKDQFQITAREEGEYIYQKVVDKITDYFNVSAGLKISIANKRIRGGMLLTLKGKKSKVYLVFREYYPSTDTAGFCLSADLETGITQEPTGPIISFIPHFDNSLPQVWSPLSKSAVLPIVWKPKPRIRTFSGCHATELIELFCQQIIALLIPQTRNTKS